MMSQETQFEELPMFWQARIKEYRAEAARYRTEKREAVVELENLRFALAELLK